MSELDLAVTRRLVIPAREIAESASRSSGPGGQHVNKSNTRVTLRWNIRQSSVLGEAERARLLHRLGPALTREGELVVHADGERSRARNLAAARRRLAERVARRARDSGRAVRLDPMNPADRRLIHLALRDVDDIATMSTGEGRYRQVVVVPEGAPDFDKAKREAEVAASRSGS